MAPIPFTPNDEGFMVSQDTDRRAEYEAFLARYKDDADGETIDYEDWLASQDWLEGAQNQADPNAHIGYLVPHPSGKGHGFLCLSCGAGIIGQIPVYGVNVNPYQASCCHCGEVVVRGCGVELYDGK